MSPREKQARERVIVAALAIAEVKALSGGEMPDPNSSLMRELCSAASALRNIVSTIGTVQ